MSDQTDASEDPEAFYQQHVFFCTNERPDGHPRGCCAGKQSVQLRNYMKARAKELGLVAAFICPQNIF